MHPVSDGRRDPDYRAIHAVVLLALTCAIAACTALPWATTTVSMCTAGCPTQEVSGGHWVNVVLAFAVLTACVPLIALVTRSGLRSELIVSGAVLTLVVSIVAAAVTTSSAHFMELSQQESQASFGPGAWTCIVLSAITSVVAVSEKASRWPDDGRDHSPWQRS